MSSFDAVNTQLRPYRDKANTTRQGFYKHADLYTQSVLPSSKDIFCKNFNTQLEPLFNKIGKPLLKRAGFIHIKMLAAAIWDIKPQDQPAETTIQFFKQNLKQLSKNENLQYLYRNLDLAFMLQDNSRLLSEVNQLKEEILYKQRKGAAHQKALLNHPRFNEDQGGFIRRVLIKTFGYHPTSILYGTWAIHALLQDKKRCHLIAKGKAGFTKEIEALYQNVLVSVSKEKAYHFNQEPKASHLDQPTIKANQARCTTQHRLFHFKNHDISDLSHQKATHYKKRRHKQDPLKHNIPLYGNTTPNQHMPRYKTKDNIALLQDCSTSILEPPSNTHRQTKLLSALNTFCKRVNPLTMKLSRDRKTSHNKTLRSHQI